MSPADVLSRLRAVLRGEAGAPLAWAVAAGAADDPLPAAWAAADDPHAMLAVLAELRQVHPRAALELVADAQLTVRASAEFESYGYEGPTLHLRLGEVDLACGGPRAGAQVYGITRTLGRYGDDRRYDPGFGATYVFRDVARAAMQLYARALDGALCDAIRRRHAAPTLAEVLRVARAAPDARGS